MAERSTGACRQVRGRSRSVLGWPLFGLALLPLTGAPANAQAPILPTGGAVTAGQASIGAPANGALTVTQASAKAIVEWQGFSIGAGGTVRFDNGSGATLNRVAGDAVSTLDGLLSASGSVYLLNPNGVIVGGSGVVDVGGSFVASTLDVSDAAFLAGGELPFAGASTAAVINLGRIGALGGDVALIATTVRNDGAITAAGNAGLASGTRVLLRDAALDGGRFTVELGGAGTSATNAGAIAAAAVELRANGGNVYALAGNGGGTIRANGVSAHDGRIYLIAGDGAVTAQGDIVARGTNGSGGFVETSGGTVDFAGARIDAGAGGTWLVDPNDLYIGPGNDSVIASALNAGTNVTQATARTGEGNGDIIIDPYASITWNTDAALTLSAFRNIELRRASSGQFDFIGTIGPDIVSTGGGAITFHADNEGTGDGAVGFGGPGTMISTSGQVATFGNSETFVYGGTDRSLVSGGGTFTAYELVNSVADLMAINNFSGAYALGRDIDAAGASIAPIGFNPNADNHAFFDGILDGQGHAIANLSISVATGTGANTLHAGLFSTIGPSGVVRDLRLTGGSVTASRDAGYFTGMGASGAVGAVAGRNLGTISNVSSSMAVTGREISAIGGLVGANDGGAIANSYSSGGVKGLLGYYASYRGSNDPIIYIRTPSGDIGGFVGTNTGTLTNSYALGSVDGLEATTAGGFVGGNSGSIDGAYATGRVIAPAEQGVAGGFVGVNANSGNGTVATITRAYWDQGTTGQVLGFGTNSGSITRLVGVGGETGLSPYAQASYTHFDFGPSGTWVIVEGATRPILRSEYSTRIANAHQLQLMALDLGASYRLIGDIDASGTGTGNDIWNPATGFSPVGPGSFSNAFAGSLDGAGHVIEGLTIRSTSGNTGLFGAIAPGGLVRDLTFGTGYVSRTETPSGGSEGTGALVGYNSGSITNVTSNVTVFGTENNIGGLVGFNAGGSIFGARATGSTTGQFARTQTQSIGGLVGFNGGPIENSSASGIVATTVQSSIGQAIPGGLVGYNLASIRNSYATGNVTLVGRGVAAGLVGSNGANPSTPPVVATSYASGRIFADAKQALVGSDYGAVTDSYYDMDTSGPSSSGIAVGNSVNRSAYSAASYAGFDFSPAGPWFLIEGATRPILRTEYSATVRNAHQLQLIALDPAATYTLASDIDLGAVRNASEVWNVASGFVPLGNAAARFTGTLDGAGRTISNLFIARPAADDVGLFGAIGTDAVLRDVILAGGRVTGRSLVGALVGNSAGTISGIRSSVTVVGTGDNVGGILGGNFGVGISDAVNTGAVTGGNATGGLVGYNTGAIRGSASNGAVSGRDVTGGLAGFNDGSGIVEDSSASGEVAGAGYVGGLAGYNSGRISRSHGDGAVAGSLGQAGGLVGLSSGSVSDSYALGTVRGPAFVGGLLGTNSGAVTGSSASGGVMGVTYVGGLAGKSDGTIAGSSASGNVAATAEHAGGLVGLSYGTISGSRATGAVAGANATGGLAGFNGGRITTSNASGAVSGQDLVGGLIGLNDIAGRADNSAASGMVTARGYGGGFVGYNSGSIDSAHGDGAVAVSGAQAGGFAGFNGGAIGAAYATGAVGGQFFVGGFVGTNAGTLILDHATGAVNGVAYVGGLAGKNDGTVSRSYAASAVTASEDGVGGLIGSNNAGRIDRVFATGAVSGRNYVGGLLGYTSTAVNDAYATGSVTGAYFVGGLAGGNAAGGALAQVYATGPVRSLTTLGGLVGDNRGTVANGYWDAGTTGAAAAFGSNGSGAQSVTAIGGTTGLNPRSQASYRGFDFASIWTIEQTRSRPYLQDAPQNPAPQ